MATALTPDDLSVWLKIHRDSRSLDSPFFHPQYTLAVGEVRDDIEVAVMEKDGEPVGFFPFQRDGRIGRPVGLRLSDFQGVIAKPGVEWNAEQLVRQCGLSSWHFDHLIADQQQFEPHHLASAESPYIELNDGWEVYAEERRRAGSKELHSTLRKTRKIEREVGALRFEFHTVDDQVFQTLIRWKSLQQKRTGAFEILRCPWVLELLDKIRTTSSDGFDGALSALYAGDELVAVHLGMRTADVLHMWFPAYNRTFEKYSPGSILLARLGEACAAMGIGRIDFGKGPEHYKLSWKSGAILVAEGAVSLGSYDRIRCAALYRSKEWVRASRFYSTAKEGQRIMRRCFRWTASP